MRFVLLLLIAMLICGVHAATTTSFKNADAKTQLGGAEDAKFDEEDSSSFENDSDNAATFPLYAEILDPAFDSYPKIQQGDTLTIHVKVSFDPDMWTGQHVPYTVCAVLDGTRNVIFARNHIQVNRDSSLFLSFGFVVLIPPGEHSVTLMIITEKEEWIRDSGDSISFMVLPKKDATALVHLVSSVREQNLSVHCMPNVEVIQHVLDPPEDQDHSNCWHTISSPSESPAQIWNKLVAAANSLGKFHYFVFWEEDAVLLMEDNFNQQRNDKQTKEAIVKFHQELSVWEPAMAFISEENVTLSQTIIPINLGAGIVAIHEEVINSLIPMETRWDLEDTRLSIAAMWLFTTAFWPYVIQPASLRITYKRNNDDLKKPQKWLSGKLPQKCSMPMDVVTTFMASAMKNPFVYTCDWGCPRYFMNNSQHCSPPLPQPRPSPPRIDERQKYTTEKPKLYFDMLTDKIVDLCHPFHFVKRPGTLALNNCDFPYHSDYQHTKREQVLLHTIQSRVNITNDQLSSLDSHLADLEQKINTVTKIIKK